MRGKPYVILSTLNKTTTQLTFEAFKKHQKLPKVIDTINKKNGCK